MIHRFVSNVSSHVLWGGCFLLASLLSPNIAQAGFTVRVGNGDGQTTPWNGAIVAGTTGVVVPVFLRADTALDSLDSYSLAIDFGGGSPGFGIPTGFSNFSADFSGAQFGSTSPGGAPFNSTLAPQLNTFFPGQINWDFRVQNTAAVASAPTTFSKLFDLKFDVASNAAPAIYDVRFVINTAPVAAGQYTDFSLAGNSIALNTITAQQGSIQITAVPEPSSMALMGLVGLGLASARRFRRARRV